MIEEMVKNAKIADEIMTDEMLLYILKRIKTKCYETECKDCPLARFSFSENGYRCRLYYLMKELYDIPERWGMDAIKEILIS